MALFITRRAALAGALVASAVAGAKADKIAAGEAIAALEKKNGGRLGVSIFDMQTQVRVGHRENERFAMCSTFKFLAAACVLSRVDRGLEQLDRRVMFQAKDLMPNSPATKAHVADGLTMAELCEAAVTLSDNTAANLMLATYGGPSGWTSYVRSLGDQVSRLDRMEPELNDWKPGEVRDTTTPAAAADDLRKIVLGDALTPQSRNQMKSWLIANKTGDKRLRAGLPKAWKVGDKTGTSGAGNFNDIAVVWPPERAPLIVCVYYSEVTLADEQANAVVAQVGAIAASLVK